MRLILEETRAERKQKRQAEERLVVTVLLLVIVGLAWQLIIRADYTSQTELIFESHTNATEKNRKTVEITGQDLNIAFLIGTSMEPTIHNGARIIEDRAWNTADIKPGVIVTYTRGEHVITHRIIATNSTHITVKGDNNTWDELIPLKNVTAIVRWVET